MLIANEQNPVAGVTLIKDGNPAPGVKYFNAGLTAIDSTLTVTGTSGVAIAPSPVAPGDTFPGFTGMGPASVPRVGNAARWLDRQHRVDHAFPPGP